MNSPGIRRTLRFSSTRPVPRSIRSSQNAACPKNAQWIACPPIGRLCQKSSQVFGAAFSSSATEMTSPSHSSSNVRASSGTVFGISNSPYQWVFHMRCIWSVRTAASSEKPASGASRPVTLIVFLLRSRDRLARPLVDAEAEDVRPVVVPDDVERRLLLRDASEIEVAVHDRL